MSKIAAFYHFTPIADPEAFRSQVRSRAEAFGLVGTVLVATEGLNATISAEPAEVSGFLDWLKGVEGFGNLEVKFASSPQPPFDRLSVRQKSEIVALGVEGIDPNKAVGQYVPPSEWDSLISRDDVLVIDCRNSYEFEVGTFEGAIDPGVDTFRAFADYARTLDPEQTPKVAMFCTGGIRCEKATSLMLDLGFRDVYHLEGGILKYLEVKGAQSKTWKGECFVFDRRVSVDRRLEPGSWEVCWACGMPINALDKASSKYEEGVSCPKCHGAWTTAQRDAKRARHRVLKARRRVAS